MTDVSERPGTEIEIRIPNRADVATYMQHGLVVGARYTARAIHPAVLARVSTRIARGIGRASYGLYWVLAAKDLADLKDTKYVDRRRIHRRKGAAIGAATILSSGIYGYVTYPQVMMGIGAAALAGFYGIGRKKTDDALVVPALPDGPLTAGVSGRQVLIEVNAAFEQLGIDAQAINAAFCGWGWEITVVSRCPISEIGKVVPKLETLLAARPGSVTPIQDPENAASVTIRAITNNPLNEVGPSPHYAPASRSILDPVDLGVIINGRPLDLIFAGTHCAVVGVTGSGKSGTVLAITDAVTACYDAIVVGADLSGGPELQSWGNCLAKYADTVEDVEALLDWAIDEATRRCRILGESARPSADDDPDDPAPSKRWVPTEQDPAIVFIADEFPLLVAAGLMEKFCTLVRLGKKAMVSLVFASQRAKKDELGSTTIRDMCGIKILHACSETDVQQLVGPGMTDQGWAPHKLIPAAGGIANDAGQCYVLAPGYTTPDLAAIHCLTEQDVRRRAIERLRYGAVPSVPGERNRGSILDAVRVIFDDNGNPTGMKTAEIVEALRENSRFTQITEASLITQLARQGVSAGRFTADGKQERGYPRKDVFAAN